MLNILVVLLTRKVSSLAGSYDTLGKAANNILLCDDAKLEHNNKAVEEIFETFAFIIYSLKYSASSCVNYQ